MDEFLGLRGGMGMEAFPGFVPEQRLHTDRWETSGFLGIPGQLPATGATGRCSVLTPRPLPSRHPCLPTC